MHIRLLYCSFTYLQSLPNFCNKIMVNITSSSPKRLDIYYTWMPSSIKTLSTSLCVLPSREGKVKISPVPNKVPAVLG
jgi:hypothetical protein